MTETAGSHPLRAPLPPAKELTVLFAHPAYRLGAEFARRPERTRFIEARSPDEVAAHLPEADVMVVSGLWRDTFIAEAPRLSLVQSISAGINQYGLDAFRAAGLRLASAQGANERAVAEHALALMLALARQLPQARDRQHQHRWRSMIADPAAREQELAGQTLVVVGLGLIGSRLARFAQALDMRVIGIRRTPRHEGDVVATIRPPEELTDILPEADIVALTCPLTPQTRGLIGPAAFAAIKPGARLINVARGAVVDENALIAALASGRLAGAGLDCFAEEPLPSGSPLWDFENVIVTPHSAGETRIYEVNIIDILVENLRRLRSGERLRNQIV